MEQLAYYNVGCQPAPGASRLKVWVRRQFRRVLLPTSMRMVEILASLCHRLDVDEHDIRDLRGQLDDLRRRHDEQSAKIPATIAFGWDYVAMVRRLAVLEEHVDALLARDAAGSAPAAFPALESVGAKLDAELAPAPSSRAKK